MKKKLISNSILGVIVLVVAICIISVKKVTIDINGNSKVVYTYEKNYQYLLQKENINLSSEDEVSVDLNEEIKRNSTIVINQVKNITIILNGNIQEYKTKSNTVGQVLKELNISISNNDKINKNIEDYIVNNDEIVINQLTTKTEEVLKDIDFNEKTVTDYKTPVGETRVIKEGENGQKKEYYTVVYEGNKEISRTLIKEEIVKEPSEKIIGVGNFDANSLTVCVNKKSQLSQDFVPSDLVLPNVRMAVSSDRLYMRKEAANALESLFNAADADGIYLYAVSGYRSYSYQSSIYNPYSGYSAPPGASEHQLGLAMDVTAAQYGGNLVTEFGYTDEGKWLAENAHKYGFVVRYLEGKEDITGYYYEPWHIRYLGVELATELKEKGLTLEEFYGEY
ncbi:D-alanyl-D-alanine carboxypeptidase family protein [Clostridium celatum]|uniref:G5 domain protein n=1 Tax=Clostridium celatum DSM 1785 TaxID=545697 RepID=L1Q6H8_9CLOT|nr:D-alanyl-D-alanine carboxypeptidase family protein [Clostridium celatum]EKY23300.1 G5 domain protein [Clostridium celatum DSM 1785]MCE9655509.1 D-alanyl-D-alanine carboxypeptidase family protein [Clostridium celatum]MDU3721853.1 D-alanyl-D-alanine carboxypeptidase family protein [Clostridium celatum]MDU6296072.1 D-alanyl-D-alanine carboxypeptidase family protein [Clostridium celatum]MDY3359039.1 D-alanyl-D-alanine carboxypeptidase family protein [Clostridium celatum]